MSWLLELFLEGRELLTHRYEGEREAIKDQLAQQVRDCGKAVDCIRVVYFHSCTPTESITCRGSKIFKILFHVCIYKEREIYKVWMSDFYLLCLKP